MPTDPDAPDEESIVGMIATNNGAHSSFAKEKTAKGGLFSRL
jgi:hypothetical protein